MLQTGSDADHTKLNVNSEGNKMCMNAHRLVSVWCCRKCAVAFSPPSPANPTLFLVKAAACWWEQWDLIGSVKSWAAPPHNALLGWWELQSQVPIICGLANGKHTHHVRQRNFSQAALTNKAKNKMSGQSFLILFVVFLETSQCKHLS